MQTNKEIEFQTKKISKLVWDYALPGIIGTVVSMIYNVIGRIFIGQGVGALAISGLAITFPVMNLTSSLGMLVGAGAAARISISLGKRDKETSEKILGNSLLLTVILNAVFITLFMIYLDPILRAFGASDLTLPYAHDYLQIVLLGNVFVSLGYNFNAMMRSSGYPKKAMITMLIGAVFSVILTPIFLYGFDLGIKGVAWATVISMFLGMLFVMHHFLQESSLIRLRWKNHTARQEDHCLHRFHRNVAFQYAGSSIRCSTTDEYLPLALRWRPGCGSLRHHQHRADDLSDDHHGPQPGYPADHRL